MFGALPVALLVKSPGVLALVSQASVAFVFFFAAVVAVLSLSPTQHNGALRLMHTAPAAPQPYITAAQPDYRSVYTYYVCITCAPTCMHHHHRACTQHQLCPTSCHSLLHTGQLWWMHTCVNHQLEHLTLHYTVVHHHMATAKTQTPVSPACENHSSRWIQTLRSHRSACLALRTRLTHA